MKVAIAEIESANQKTRYRYSIRTRPFYRIVEIPQIIENHQKFDRTKPHERALHVPKHHHSD